MNEDYDRLFRHACDTDDRVDRRFVQRRRTTTDEPTNTDRGRCRNRFKFLRLATFIAVATICGVVKKVDG